MLSQIDPKTILFPEAKEVYLRIQAWANKVTTIYVTVVTRDGISLFTLTTTSDRIRRTFETRLSSLPIAVAVETLASDDRLSEIYCRVFLRVGGMTAFTLVEGRLAYTKLLSWPPGEFRESIVGPGTLRSVLGTDPAVGVEVSETVPTNTRWLLRGMRVTLVTDATVIARTVRLLIDDGANTLFLLPAQTNQSASYSFNYHAVPLGYQPAAVGLEITIPLPPVGILLLQGWRIRTLTSNFQVGDDYGAPRMLIEEWLED